MKIKDIERIASENIEKREQEIGRKFSEKERAIAILVEQLKITEFDPNFFFNSKTEGKFHEETKAMLKCNSRGEPITIDDVGEMDVEPEETCKILAMIYKYIADKNGLNAEWEGQEYMCGTWNYQKYSELYTTSIDEHLYAIVNLKNGSQLKIDVQDEARAIKTKSRPRHLGGRISSEYLFTQEDDEIRKIMEAIGYIGETESYTDDYANRLARELENSTKSEYEKARTILYDDKIKQALKNAGVVASYQFYEKYLKKIVKSTYDFSGKTYIFPCYRTVQLTGEQERISHSYFIYLIDGENHEIYMYSKKKGVLEQVSPEFVRYALDEESLQIGYKNPMAKLDSMALEGKEKLINYVRAQTQGDGVQGDSAQSNGAKPSASGPSEGGEPSSHRACTDSIDDGEMEL